MQRDNLAIYEDTKNWNSILNLAHLDANENQSRQDKDLGTWVAKEAERQSVSQLNSAPTPENPWQQLSLNFGGNLAGRSP